MSNTRLSRVCVYFVSAFQMGSVVACLRYREGSDSLFESNGEFFQLDTIFAIVETKPTTRILINRVNWMLEGTQLDNERVRRADLSVPIIVTTFDNKTLVVDGVHRVRKAVDEGNTFILCKWITPTELSSAKITSR